jgi:hypothetical protein
MKRRIILDDGADTGCGASRRRPPQRQLLCWLFGVERTRPRFLDQNISGLS